jgi:energy-coupling factor transporter transmembrane protein EcfT
VHFWERFLHPASALLICLTVIVAIQFSGPAGLALVLLALVLEGRRVLPGWWTLLRRMRWLLLGVWLILAYGMPGDALLDVAWLPTHEGSREATLQAARLVLTVGCLAWLFALVGRDGLRVALISLLRPLSRAGLATDRLVVRLSLVMDNLQSPLTAGAWRAMLHPSAEAAAGPTHLRVAVPAWRPADYFHCVAVLAISSFLVGIG